MIVCYVLLAHHSSSLQMTNNNNRIELLIYLASGNEKQACIQRKQGTEASSNVGFKISNSDHGDGGVFGCGAEHFEQSSYEERDE